MGKVNKFAVLIVLILSLVGCSTPLINASADGNIQTATSLIDNGADVNESVRGGVTPLFYAVIREKPEMVKLLLDKGADVNAKTILGYTSLHASVSPGNISIVQMLLEKGADVNMQDNKGNTALFYAVHGGNSVIIQMLIKKGAEVNIHDLQLAEQKGNTKIIKMLKAAQSNTTLGYTPVMYSGSAILIAVIDFDAKGVTRQDAMRVSEWLRNEMINTGQFKVIERSAMNAILKEQAFSMTGCTDTSCAVEVGKLLSARKMLVGSVELWNNKIFINGRIIDVEKGVAEFAHKETVNSVKELDTRAASFAKNLARRINGLQAE